MENSDSTLTVELPDELAEFIEERTLGAMASELQEEHPHLSEQEARRLARRQKLREEQGPVP